MGFPLSRIYFLPEVSCVCNSEIAQQANVPNNCIIENTSIWMRRLSLSLKLAVWIKVCGRRLKILFFLSFQKFSCSGSLVIVSLLGSK